MERLSFEKAFHPFIAGAYNRLVQELSQETGARISIPPPSIPKDEIVITGEKEAVAMAIARIRAIYEEKVIHNYTVIHNFWLLFFCFCFIKKCIPLFTKGALN